MNFPSVRPSVRLFCVCLVLNVFLFKNLSYGLCQYFSVYLSKHHGFSCPNARIKFVFFLIISSGSVPREPLLFYGPVLSVCLSACLPVPTGVHVQCSFIRLFVHFLPVFDRLSILVMIYPPLQCFFVPMTFYLDFNLSGHHGFPYLNAKTKFVFFLNISSG
jgi:hypothetical protein